MLCLRTSVTNDYFIRAVKEVGKGQIIALIDFISTLSRIIYEVIHG